MRCFIGFFGESDGASGYKVLTAYPSLLSTLLSHLSIRTPGMLLSFLILLAACSGTMAVPMTLTRRQSTDCSCDVGRVCSPQVDAPQVVQVYSRNMRALSLKQHAVRC